MNVLFLIIALSTIPQFLYIFAPKADYSYHVLDIESGRYNKVKNLSNFRDGHPSIKNKKVVEYISKYFGYQKL